MKLQNLTVIFIIIIIPIILLVSLYITSGLKTLKYQSLYDTGLMTATHDAIYAFEQNSADDKYSSNPEKKRDILKSSIKMFEKSLANTCGISSYSYQEIEEYIPAIVFGMYDGFYMYAPSKEYTKDEDGNEKYEYKHNLKNYVYYSEILDDGTVIRYSLDNYVVVTGNFNGKYLTRGGYLAVGASSDGKTYQSISIIREDNLLLEGHHEDGIKYYEEAAEFTDWFLNEANMGSKAEYLNISTTNDPEDENSAFVQHKREIIKYKIENVLNSSITAYSQRMWGKVYKMPKFSEEDWQKIYNNISMITFLQGKNIGLTTYNGYCVLNSTNSREYVNPNLMYFIAKDGYYHDIRCPELLNPENASDYRTGYRIGKFEKRKVDKEIEVEDEEGNIETEIIQVYEYDFKDCLACYTCINGAVENVSPYEYVRNTSSIKTSYFTSLGRERYNGAKPYKIEHGESPVEKYSLYFEENCPGEIVNNMPDDISGLKSQDKIPLTGYQKPTTDNYNFEYWSTDPQGNNRVDEIIIADSNITLYAIWSNIQVTLTFHANPPAGKTTTGAVPSSMTVNKGSNISLSMITCSLAIEGGGYRLDGWKTLTATNKQNSIYMDEDKDVYAIWIKQVTLEFHANPPAGKTYTGTIPTKKTVDINTPYTLGTTSSINVEGYKFIGWNVSKTATTKQDSIYMDGNKDVYAVWKKYVVEHTIKRYNGGTQVKYYTTFSEAMNALNSELNERKEGKLYTDRNWQWYADEHTIKLFEDVTKDIEMLEPISGDINNDTVTIDLNWYTYNGKIKNEKDILQIKNGTFNGKLELRQGTLDADDRHDLIFDNVTFNSNNKINFTENGTKNYSGIWLNDYHFTINNSTITSNSNTYPTIYGQQTDLTIINSTIQNNGTSYAVHLKVIDNGQATLAMSGDSSKIISKGLNSTVWLDEDTSGAFDLKLTMTGGKIQNEGAGTAITGEEKSEITISGGTINSSGSNPTIWIGKDSKLTISGKTEINNSDSGSAITGCDFEKILISGGTITNKSSINATIYLYKEEDRLFDSSYTILDIDGGTITNDGGGYQIETLTRIKDGRTWKHPTLDFDTSGYSINQKTQSK